jgi:hypothetical protein
VAKPEVKIDGDGVKGSMLKKKLPVDLVPPLFIKLVALVLLFGSRKYKANNWLKGMSWSEVAAGAKRHIDDFLEGNEYDSESKLPHLAHAACCLMFLIWYAYGPQSKKYRRIGDDRLWARSKEPDPWAAEVERINKMDFSNIAVPAKDANQ